MHNSLLLTIKKRKLALFSVVYFLVLTAWWLSIYFRGLTEGSENDFFTVSYWWVAIWGGIAGLLISKKWGGLKSILGKSFIAFSVGILLQGFGQIVYSYYIYILHIEVPYPSIGDIAYFSTGLFYIYGLVQLARATGFKLSLRTYRSRISALILPILFVIGAYFLFLRGHQIDFSVPVTTLLDFGYPFVDAIVMSLAILVYSLSRKILGGIMKAPVLFLLLALIVEAVADYTFVYQVANELWYVGGINDFMYLLSYSLMAIALMQLGVAFDKLTEEQT